MNVWDIPVKPETGDADIQAIYIAVGKALSTWERVNLEFSVVYANILGVPLQIACHQPKYAEEERFIRRVILVEQAWKLHVHKICNQAIEYDFKVLIEDLRGLSSRRNDIAHGIVFPLNFEDAKDGYVLLPAMFIDRRFNTNDEPEYVYSSTEINALERKFSRMILHCVQVHHLVAGLPDPYPELRSKPPPDL